VGILFWSSLENLQRILTAGVQMERGWFLENGLWEATVVAVSCSASADTPQPAQYLYAVFCDEHLSVV